MNKTIRFTLICLAAVLVCASCTPAGSSATDAPEASAQPPVSEVREGSIGDYFPFVANAAYEYEGNGVTYKADYSVYNGFLDGDRVQRRVSTGFEDTTEVLHLSDGALTLVYGDPYYYFYDNILDKEPNLNIVLLKEPLEPGQKWDAMESEDGVSVSEVTSADTHVSTPAGDFSALEVTTTRPDGNIEIYYYAKGVGLVKSVYDTPQGQVVSSLASVKEDTGVEVPVAIYVPNITKGEMDAINTRLALITNTAFENQLTERLKKAPSADHKAALPESAAINSIALNWTDGVAVVDLSPDYTDASEASDSVQRMMLQAIADTVGNFYGVKKVTVTVAGKPFEEGGIAFAEGEYIDVTPLPEE